MWYARLLETNLIPDALIQVVLRIVLRNSLRRRYRVSLEQRVAEKRALVEKFRRSPIAIYTEDANRQHYEVPAAFFRLVLGKWLKYSCCYWPDRVRTLDEAEEAMLRLTCARAQLQDGMDILDLGSGWGSLSLWIATRYPNSRVIAVSNSVSQRTFIESRCQEMGLNGVQAVTADINDFVIDRRFDRILSIEMFEHMKNYEQLMAKIAALLKPNGLLFVHHFSHREFAYEFPADDPRDWMAQNFFRGGTMPSDDLLLNFQRDLQFVHHWHIPGTHYTHTLRAWLEKLDRHQPEVRRVLAQVYGPRNERRALVNWRMFFLGCAETFNVRQGSEYGISHYLFKKR